MTPPAGHLSPTVPRGAGGVMSDAAATLVAAWPAAQPNRGLKSAIPRLGATRRRVVLSLESERVPMRWWRRLQVNARVQ
jgi:hypothetical protein